MRETKVKEHVLTYSLKNTYLYCWHISQGTQSSTVNYYYFCKTTNKIKLKILTIYYITHALIIIDLVSLDSP